MAALEAKFSFDAMVGMEATSFAKMRHYSLFQIHADLLVAAASGFSRLAAVLRNKSVLTFELESHPLAYLDCKDVLRVQFLTSCIRRHHKSCNPNVC
jgi:hypothetical protein